MEITANILPAANQAPLAIAVRGASESALAALDPLAHGVSSLQPITDVAKYLKERKPVPHFKAEPRLWMKMTGAIAKEISALLGAFDLVLAFTHKPSPGLSVQAACKRAMKAYSTWNWKLKTFRRKFDNWVDSRDWFVLVNRCKAGAEFQNTDAGLPEAFLDHVAIIFGEFGRSDAKEQALASIERHWRTGRDHRGIVKAIPGYEDGWDKRVTALFPLGWDRGNIRRQMKARAKFTLAVQALLHDSEAKAREYQPQVNGTREGMRFMEEITFDDLRFDFMIFNPETGQAEELWALIARETSCGIVLGGVLYPATERPDGKVSHLGAKQMKELAGQLLELYPLPPYIVHWKVERGTATIALGLKMALAELFGDRIHVSYTMMIGGTSPVGYREKAKGNSRGKASHESHNRLFHTQGSFIPGQIGNRYDVRPADLKARIEECQEIWAKSRNLPEAVRAQVKYPLLTLEDARVMFRTFCSEQNFRTEHKLEGFKQVLEWFNPEDGKVHPHETAPHPLPEGAKWMPRMESPVERAERLIRAVPKWEPCSPRIVVALLEHTQRVTDVKPNGEIVLDHEGKKLRFVNSGTPLLPGTDVLAYFNANDPGFLHLTNGKGQMLGTWLRKGKVRFNDREGLADAMRYTSIGQQAARVEAQRLAAPRREHLDALRVHNAQLQEFVDVTPPPKIANDEPAIGSPIGAAIVAVADTAKAKAQKQKKQDSDAAKDAAAARKTLMESFQ
jgi:hypothetical protein